MTRLPDDLDLPPFRRRATPAEPAADLTVPHSYASAMDALQRQQAISVRLRLDLDRADERLRLWQAVAVLAVGTALTCFLLALAVGLR